MDCKVVVQVGWAATLVRRQEFGCSESVALFAADAARQWGSSSREGALACGDDAEIAEGAEGAEGPEDPEDAEGVEVAEVAEDAGGAGVVDAALMRAPQVGR